MKTNNHHPTFSLTIGWLYPELMSIYGDRGNVIVLQKRCEWRGIKVNVVPIDQTTNDQKLKTIDLLFGGGAQDREQMIVMKDLQKKEKIIKALIEKGVPALFVCGAFQLFGRCYETPVGKQIKGLGIFAMDTKHSEEDQERLTGNVTATVQWKNFSAISHKPLATNHIVGFENHSGRTYLDTSAKPFATVLKGFGNNGKDKTEGIIYNNAIGTYLHGPLLPLNEHIADFLIEQALKIKYKKEIKLKKLQ